MIRISNLILLICIFVFMSCSSGDSDSLKQKLLAFCVRECVLETADSEICDDKCKCAANKVSDELSRDKYRKIEEDVSQNPNLVQKLRNALGECGNLY